MLAPRCIPSAQCRILRLGICHAANCRARITEGFCLASGVVMLAMPGDEVHAIWQSRQGVGTSARLLGPRALRGRADAWRPHEVAMSLSCAAVGGSTHRAGLTSSCASSADLSGWSVGQRSGTRNDGEWKAAESSGLQRAEKKRTAQAGVDA
ncbi:hypothetical protein PSPO01_03510 [Paraphaeosphaeria sporulosa]